MGTCQRAQIVNYVQRGFRSKLCDNESVMDLMHGSYQALKMVKGIAGQGKVPIDQENDMSDVGKKYADELAKNPDKPDVDSIRKRLAKPARFVPRRSA